MPPGTWSCVCPVELGALTQGPGAARDGVLAVGACSSVGESAFFQGDRAQTPTRQGAHSHLGTLLRVGPGPVTAPVLQWLLQSVHSPGPLLEGPVPLRVSEGVWVAGQLSWARQTPGASVGLLRPELCTQVVPTAGLLPQRWRVTGLSSRRLHPGTDPRLTVNCDLSPPGGDSRFPSGPQCQSPLCSATSCQETRPWLSVLGWAAPGHTLLLRGCSWSCCLSCTLV